MKIPNALAQLIEELKDEDFISGAETLKTSKAIIYPDDEAARAEDGITLNEQECRLLFADVSTVERMKDAIETKNASLALFDITVSSQVIEVLERSFIAVDEG